MSAAQRRLLALLGLACLAVCAVPDGAHAQGGPVPFSGKTLNFQPALLPWPKKSRTAAWSAFDSGVSALKLWLGPCWYRQVHTHFFAVEPLFGFKGTVHNVQIHPLNGTVYNHALTPGVAVTIPTGWLHYQYNPTCEDAEAYGGFSASNIGANVVSNLVGLPTDYLESQFASGAPKTAENKLWFIDAKCYERCYGEKYNGEWSDGWHTPSPAPTPSPKAGPAPCNDPYGCGPTPAAGY